jgi:hypothetical protein
MPSACRLSRKTWPELFPPRSRSTRILPEQVGVDVPVGGRTLDQFIADLCDDAEASPDQARYRHVFSGCQYCLAWYGDRHECLWSGTDRGCSGWGYHGSGSAQANSAVNISSLTYVDVMTLAYTSFGGDLLLLATADGYIFSGTPGDFYLSVRNDTDTDVDLINQPGDSNTETMGRDPPRHGSGCGKPHHRHARPCRWSRHNPNLSPESPRFGVEEVIVTKPIILHKLQAEMRAAGLPYSGAYSSH